MTAVSRTDLLRPAARMTNYKIKGIRSFNPNNRNMEKILERYEDQLLFTSKQAITPEDKEAKV